MGLQLSSDSSLLLQVLALFLQLCGQPLKLHWVHKVRDWTCGKVVPVLAALAPSEAGTSLLGLCMAPVTPLRGCVPTELGCSYHLHSSMSLGWEYSQCSKHGAQSSAANPDGEGGVSGLAGVHKEGMKRTLPGLQDAVCSHNCPLHVPQVLLILTALVVAAAFTGLGIKWAEEWKSARISLQVSDVHSRDSPTVPSAWPVGLG